MDIPVTNKALGKGFLSNIRGGSYGLLVFVDENGNAYGSGDCIKQREGYVLACDQIEPARPLDPLEQAAFDDYMAHRYDGLSSLQKTYQSGLLTMKQDEVAARLEAINRVLERLA